MPYCRKCGTELDPNSKFCHDCGTEVAPAPTTPTPYQAQSKKTKFPIAGVILIAILAFAAIIVAISIFPTNPVSFSQTDVASSPNVNSLNMTIIADVARANVMFKELPGNQRATTNTTATGSQGIFSSDQPISLSFKEETTDQTLTYTVEIRKTDQWNLFSNMQVTCDLVIDPTAELNLTIRTTTGEILFNSDQTVKIQSLNLRNTAGTIDATVTEKTTIAKSVQIETTAGSAHLHWNEPNVTGNIPVNLRATAGSVTATIAQEKQLSGNVTLKAETTTGEVDLALDIRGGVGAKIETESGAFSTVDIDQTGFSSNNAPLNSNNYPAESNFLITLKATTGRIHIDANYDPGINN